jgi:WD40 repeat protein
MVPRRINEKEWILWGGRYHYLTQHGILQNGFPKQYWDFKVKRFEFTPVPPLSANYDFNEKDHVFCFDQNLVVNNWRKSTEFYCNDAKISRDGRTVAYAVRDTIYFMDIETKEVKYSLKNKASIVHLSYSLDGLTIAAALTSRELVIWDLE